VLHTAGRRLKYAHANLMLAACYDHAMSALQVKNFPDDLHAKLRERAARQGRSVSGYVLEALERDLAIPSTREWLNSLEEDPSTDVRSQDIVRAVQEGRDEREEQLERAFLNRH
jgi:antitoxin FitA